MNRRSMTRRMDCETSHVGLSKRLRLSGLTDEDEKNMSLEAKVEKKEEDDGDQNLEVEDLVNSSSDEDVTEEDSEESTSDSELEAEDNENELPQRTMFQGFSGMNGMRAPLKDNGQLTSLDHLLLELTYTIRYNNTYEQLVRRLQLLKKMYVNINIPTTKMALWRILGRDDSNLIYRLYCEKCSQLVGNGKKVERDCDCGSCGPYKEETFIATFIQIRVAPQIKEFLNSPKAAEALRYKETRVKFNPNAIEDIYDGEEYQRKYKEYFAEGLNFTLSLWTKGLKLTKSSKSACYPFLLQLNELSPYARKRNMFLAGLWIGKGKPNMGIIMKPIVEDMNELHDSGISWKPTAEQEIVSKFTVSIFTADSDARAMVLRMNHYNQEYGCTFCLAPGKNVEKRWIYNATPAALRTMETMKKDIQEAVINGNESRGVVGCSRLGSLRKFDLIAGQVVDIAHNDYLGNGKKFNERHMKDVGKPWYIGQVDKKKKINEILTTIETPSRISLKPRSIETSKTWNASEWRNWILYYSLPCLDEILEEPFFSHHAKYCEAMFILNNTSITNEDLTKAKSYLDEFVNETEIYYGEKNMRFNVHLNKHSIKSIENWGPAWVYSTLPFESMNQPITKSITSPNHRAEQIVTRFFMRKFILRMAEEENISPITRKEIEDLFDKKTVHVPSEMMETHYFVGKEKLRMRHANPAEIQLMANARTEIKENTMLSFFEEAIIHGVSYVRKKDTDQKYCDYIAYSRGKKFIIIKDIISFCHEDETVAGFIGEEFHDLGGAYNTQYMRFVTSTRKKIFISYHDVLAPGLIINAKKGTVAVRLSNCWEID
ncbi:uncharacterized protein LOC127285746 [Leptopilina boulardi]|uniref:uncharacterized protein LOC127285746 n=1 Tax=Leptopilina boulardi TaxID=63433 RepID=UPI0021F5323A|nr:uncharacterized protein LOC127285746 [Leptopilina boulardi]XP_051167851.1 uncharacterized protein LOC127285746 [Leptopilina boulardi]